MAKEKKDKVKLPVGVTQEQYDSTKKIIVSGFKADQKPDAIKAAIFESGIPFSKLNKLYSEIAKSEGLIVDPSEIKKGIEAGLKNFKINEKADYVAVVAAAETVAEKVQGATAAKVITAIKNIYKDNEVEFPRKPAPSRGKMGVINKTIVDVFKKNPKASQDDLEKALAKVTKTLKNANDYAKSYHKMAYALANGLSSLEVLTAFSKDNK